MWSFLFVKCLSWQVATVRRQQQFQGLIFQYHQVMYFLLMSAAFLFRGVFWYFDSFFLFLCQRAKIQLKRKHAHLPFTIFTSFSWLFHSLANNFYFFNMSNLYYLQGSSYSIHFVISKLIFFWVNIEPFWLCVFVDCCLFFKLSQTWVLLHLAEVKWLIVTKTFSVDKELKVTYWESQVPRFLSSYWCFPWELSVSSHK